MMNLNNTLIKKFNFDVLAFYLFFLWKISPGIFADGFNYDDSHEILISRADSVYDFFAFADHHFLYSLTLYLLIFFIPFTKLQVINIFLVVVIFYQTKKLYEKLELSYLSFVLNIFILVSSPIFLQYSLRIKQYTLDYLLTLILIYTFIRLEKKEIPQFQFVLTGVLISIFSLILIPVFIILFLLNFKNNLKGINLKTIFITVVAIFLFTYIGSVRLKIFDEKFIDYYSFSFSVEGNFLYEILNLYSELLIFFRGISDNGYLSIYLLIFVYGLYKFSKNKFKKILVGFVLLFLIFCFLHILNFYPIGAGRNMTFIFPFIILFLSYSINDVNFDRKNILFFVLASVVFLNFTKIEYPDSFISNILEETSINELIIVDYYLIPQFSLYSNDDITTIKRRYFTDDKCLYSSNKHNIIFLQDKLCNPIELNENNTIKYEQYQKITFIGEENSYNNYKKIKELFKKEKLSLISDIRLDKSYRLSYEK